MKNNKKSITKRHQRFNTIIGLVLLIIVVGGIAFSIYFVLKKFFGLIASFIKWIEALSNTLDAVVIVALITGTVSIIGVIISSIVAKYIEHKHRRMEYLTQKREKSYGEFVEMIYKIQKNGKNGFEYTQVEMLDDLSKFSREITLWGSSKIVRKWGKFRESSNNTQQVTQNLFILEDIMNEMRKDLGLKKVKKTNLLAFFINDIKKYK